jgi:hypothetical protein
MDGWNPRLLAGEIVVGSQQGSGAISCMMVLARVVDVLVMRCAFCEAPYAGQLEDDNEESLDYESRYNIY